MRYCYNDNAYTNCLYKMPIQKGCIWNFQVDISGHCPTTYYVSGNTYTKTRDLNACSHRVGGFSIFHGVAYDSQSVSLLTLESYARPSIIVNIVI